MLHRRHRARAAPGGARAGNQELETAYEELQSTNEELETTNEELQSTVEELETTNEELQSTNEELETMNEELQSTNEELQTINDELRERGDELDAANAFLESILTSLGAASRWWIASSRCWLEPPCGGAVGPPAEEVSGRTSSTWTSVCRWSGFRPPSGRACRAMRRSSR